MGMLNPSQFNQWFEYSFSCHKISKTLLLVSFVLLSLGHHDCIYIPSPIYTETEECVPANETDPYLHCRRSSQALLSLTAHSVSRWSGGTTGTQCQE